MDAQQIDNILSNSTLEQGDIFIGHLLSEKQNTLLKSRLTVGTIKSELLTFHSVEIKEAGRDFVIFKCSPGAKIGLTEKFIKRYILPIFETDKEDVYIVKF